MKRMRVLLFALGCVLPAIPARAQTDEVRPVNSNRTFIAPATAPVASNQAALPATANSNFQGAGSMSGSSGPIDTTPDIPLSR